MLLSTGGEVPGINSRKVIERSAECPPPAYSLPMDSPIDLLIAGITCLVSVLWSDTLQNRPRKPLLNEALSDLALLAIPPAPSDCPTQLAYCSCSSSCISACFLAASHSPAATATPVANTAPNTVMHRQKAAMGPQAIARFFSPCINSPLSFLILILALLSYGEYRAEAEAEAEESPMKESDKYPAWL